MRILIATHYFASHKGGIEIVAEKLFREFSGGGHEVVWIAGDSTPPPPESGQSRAVPIKVFNFIERKTGVPFPIPTLGAIRKLRSQVSKADVVLLHDCLYLSNIAAFRKARRSRIPTIIVQHIGFVPYKNIVLNTALRIANAFVTRPMLHCASRVVFISRTTLNYFAKVRFARSPEIIFNGVDAELYRPAHSHEEKLELRRHFNLPLDLSVVLFVGRFVEKKGLEILHRMVAEKPECAWAFAGWGPNNPQAWGLDNVHVFSGLRGESLAGLYRACDVFLLPSVGEGFPLVIQEALASGLPVVCGTETVLADPDLSSFAIGVQVNLAKPEQTARSFIEALDKMRESNMSADDSYRRREFALQRYSWRHAAEKYLEIAGELVSHFTSQSAVERAGETG